MLLRLDTADGKNLQTLTYFLNIREITKNSKIKTKNWCIIFAITCNNQCAFLSEICIQILT